MEAVENAFVAGKILWLAQTILESTSNGKLGEWIRHAGLGEAMKKLTSEIERDETVVAAVKGRVTGNKPLARSLARLKDLLYDADDLVDELDYYRLQEQVQGDAIACANEPEGSTDGGGAEQMEGSRGNPDLLSRKKRKNRSKYWDHFYQIRVDGKLQGARCKYCHDVEIKCGGETGNHGLKRHFESEICQNNRRREDQPPNPTSATDGVPNDSANAIHDSFHRKRLRVYDASTQNATANVHPWNNTDFSERIQQITIQLQGCRGDVSEFLKDSVIELYPSNTSNTCLRTSGLAPPKVYGREREKDDIMTAITTTESDSITVLPIVGVAGVGKTAIAQLVYNDPSVESQFERIWIWVSENFDKVILTKEMLDSISQGMHAGISGYDKVQSILKGYMECLSKKFLLILDDVWDSMKGHIWNELLSPLQSRHVKGSVILITTRNMSVAQRIGTMEPIKLHALKKEDSWLLCKAFAFGNENHKLYPTLSIIGQQIAEKLKGNPLAAETAGEVLREHLTVNHWSSVLKNECWKSLQLSRGIMTSLNLSYNHLPYHLQQCFLYCSIFPNNYPFLADDLVRIWISQGFVRRADSSKTLEEIGQEYFIALENLCVFETVERDKSTPSGQTYHVMCGVMLDFARVISRSECAVIEGTECNDIPPTIRHLSILTDSAYYKDKHGNLPHDFNFEEKLQGVAISARRLRTLVLTGKCDSFTFQSIQDIFKNAPCLRMLRVSEIYTDFRSLLCGLLNYTHLRYLKLEIKENVEDLPIHLGKFYQLQVLDVGRATIPSGMNGLVSMRGLVLKKTSDGFEMLRSMNDLVHLSVYQLENVNRAEADGARLRDKQHLKKLHLSWKDILPQDEDASGKWSGSEDESEDFSDSSGSEGESLPVSNCNLISEYSTDNARDVLEGLEPHRNLKHLKVSGYSDTTSPAWFSTSVTCLRTLHLEDCRKLRVLPSLERLPLLTKLKLRHMWEVTEVSIPSLEEVVLIKMPKLERCSCNSMGDLNSSLRVLMIKRCYVLKDFPLFESREKFRIQHKSWLSSLSKLTIHDCPQLMVSNPLPPSSSACELSIKRVSTLPTMKGSSNGELIIMVEGKLGQLTKLDHKILSFHNLRMLTRMQIADSFVSLEALKQLISLKRLSIIRCHGHFYSLDVVAEHACVDMADANSNALSNLKYLRINSGSISGKWLSVLLQHAPVLEELELEYCVQISGLLIEGKESCLSNHNSNPWASLPGNQDDASTSSSREAVHSVLRIPSNLLSALKKMSVGCCQELTFQGNEEGFSALASLEELTISHCPKLVSSLVVKDENSDYANRRCRRSCSPGEAGIVEPESLEKLQLCPRGSPSRLKKLEIWQNNSGLASLDLDSFTALEELVIGCLDSLTAIEGLQSLRGLRYLEVRGCPRLPPFLERLSGRVNELFPRLDRLAIDDYSFLTASFCKHLASLKRLQFYSEAGRPTDEQERALQLLTSLQELRCWCLGYLPVCLHSLASLKRLEITFCRDISGLPEKGLPPSLEELAIEICSQELTEQFRELGTSMLKVKIDGRYVN